jgi:hypothetical protein
MHDTILCNSSLWLVWVERTWVPNISTAGHLPSRPSENNLLWTRKMISGLTRLSTVVISQATSSSQMSQGRRQMESCDCRGSQNMGQGNTTTVETCRSYTARVLWFYPDGSYSQRMCFSCALIISTQAGQRAIHCHVLIHTNHKGGGVPFFSFFWVFFWMPSKFYTCAFRFFVSCCLVLVCDLGGL